MVSTAMPILRNNRHEVFARKIATGAQPKVAYKQIYPNFKSGIKQGAVRLLSDVRARVRVEELTKQFIKAKEDEFRIEADGAQSKEWILNSLFDLAQRCMQTDVFRDRKTGQPIMITGPDGMQYAAMAQYSPRDAIRALELLGRERGMFIERRATKEVDDLENMRREELERIVYGRTLAEIEEERRAKALPAPGKSKLVSSRANPSL
jgi:phage terminase small subunit